MSVAFWDQMICKISALKVNKSMIAKMSHDIRTPLTMLILYVEILCNEKAIEEGEKGAFLYRTAPLLYQIKNLTNNILQYSIRPKEIDDLTLEQMNFQKAFYDLLFEMYAYLSQYDYVVKVESCWPQDTVTVNIPIVLNVMNTITSNIDRFADKASPVRITMKRTGPMIELTFEYRVDRKKVMGKRANMGLSCVHTMMRCMGGNSCMEKRGVIVSIHLLFMKQKEIAKTQEL